jgi:hypothetical protein
MKSWTIKQMLAEKPCREYDEARLRKLWAKRRRLTLLDILALRIPAPDRIWVVFRPDALTAKQRAAVLDRTVTRAVRTRALHCGIPAVEAWAAGWLSGADRSESAAGAANAASAASAAWGATWSAERSAANAASAERSAAWGAESAAGAAWSAERSAERSAESAASAAWGAASAASAANAASAAWSAERSAERSAESAASAAWSAERSAERRRQLADVRAVLGGGAS